MCKKSNSDRNITARALSRDASTILDDVEFDGVSMLVIRHSRVVARITPFADAPPMTRQRQSTPETGSDTSAKDAQHIELDPDEQEILRTAQGARGFWRREMMRDRHTEYWRAARRLEDRELLFHGWMGHQLTHRARAVLKDINASDAISEAVPLA